MMEMMLWGTMMTMMRKMKEASPHFQCKQTLAPPTSNHHPYQQLSLHLHPLQSCHLSRHSMVLFLVALRGRQKKHEHMTTRLSLSYAAKHLENDSKFRSAELKTRQCELELKRKETVSNILKLHEEARSKKICRCALMLRERKLLQDLGIDQNEIDKALPLEF
jgi:hypothetical protein